MRYGLTGGVTVLLMVGAGIAGVQTYHLTLNVGHSLAGTVYACRALHPHEPLPHGVVVYYHPPPDVRATLQRIAPGADVRLGWLKQVAAVGGDEVCWEHEYLDVNQWRVGALVLLNDYPLIVPSGTCHVLGEKEVLTMGTATRSFDGRYTGPMRREEIQERCIALF